jgi:hypothetical protein
MLDQYHVFTFADPVFYESPANSARGEVVFPATVRNLPAGWRRARRDLWVSVDPEGVRLPAQGWKVHVSACLDNAEHVLDVVWDYCLERGIPFKFLPSRQTLAIFNGKYMPRETSGKFLALYPADDEQLRRVLDELSAQLSGQEGPYILSDLRWGSGPLYVRYGGFRERYCTTADGEAAAAIERPDGTLVPDLRRPVFQPPSWVEPPDFVVAEMAARRARRVADLPYTILEALHFSNGGGVYLAERVSDGTQVVLKEARPHAGLDRGGRDAVERLQHEYGVLRRLEGIRGVPTAYEYLTVGEHHLLAMEHVPGDVIWKWAAMFHPLVDAAPSDADVAAYTARALALAGRVEELLDEIHDRGVIYGDLHPGNVLVTPDDAVALIDFEVSGEVADSGFQPALGASGFRPARHGKRGIAVDRLALAALRLWLFLQLDRVWELDPRTIATTIDEAERRFPLPREVCAALRRELLLPADAGDSVGSRASQGLPLEVDLAAPEPDLAGAARSLVDAILSSATPQRADRLFPGDIQQFSRGGADFAHGAAGVLWALQRTGFGRYPEYEQWVLDAVARGLRPRPGFYTGLHGIAYVLDQLGHREAALALLDQAAPLVPAVREPGLFKGLSGIGLNLLVFARETGDSRHLEQARAVGEQLARLLDQAVEGAPDKAGLLYGWSGVALFFLRLWETDGSGAWLDAAVRALHRDLDACIVRHDGTLLVKERGGRALPYLASGSAGVGLVLDEVLQHRQDDRLREHVPSMLNVFQPESVVESNLLEGRAGLLAALARLSLNHPGDEAEEAIARHVRGLSSYALSYRGHLAFPGRRQFRLSMDLATGNAGVLLAITTVQNRKTEFLPFLGPGPDS